MDPRPKWSCFPEPQYLTGEEALSYYSDADLLSMIDNANHRYRWAADVLLFATKEGWTVNGGIPELVDCAERRLGGTIRLLEMLEARREAYGGGETQ